MPLRQKKVYIHIYRVFGCLYLLVLASRDVMSCCLVVVSMRARCVFGYLRADVEPGSHDI
jgi:hypothetical protein